MPVKTGCQQYSVYPGIPLAREWRRICLKEFFNSLATPGPIVIVLFLSRQGLSLKVHYLMTMIKTPLQAYKLLPKSNCGECRVSTCMAFAAAIIKQEKRPAECPHLDKATLAFFEGKLVRQVNIESIQEESLKDLQKKISAIDLASRAECLGAQAAGGTLAVRCLGRDFEIDAQGTVRSQCHTHAWFSIPLLNYILFSKGEANTGRWVPFRELRQGKTWNPLFERRCEQPLKHIADARGDLFEDLISMFSGESSFNNFSSDISVVLYPLPKVPILVCYWKPEEDLESRLHLFFDDTAEENLPVESLFTLGTGLVRMLEKIMHTHAHGKSELP
jgi:hypothetical protein